MDITEIILACAIALIHPYFFHKLVDRIMGYDTVDEMCTQMAWDSSQYKQCSATRNTELDKMELKRHIAFLVIALLSILISSMIRQKSTKLGIGLGGIFLLIIALTLYWRKYNENAKLIILGISLVTVIYISIRLYTVGSLADVFSLEFGTKQID
jgi:Na+/proline symporter